MNWCIFYEEIDTSLDLQRVERCVDVLKQNYYGDNLMMNLGNHLPKFGMTMETNH